MIRDFLLASIHHLLAFGLIAMLASQAVLLSRPLDGAVLRRLAGIDRGYGLTAGLLLTVGLMRVFQGIKGPGFYLHNPWFHAKLGAYLLAALLSLWPTLRFLRWRKGLHADAGYLPPANDVRAMRGIVRFELILFGVILVCAAGMARYGGLHF